MNLKNKLTLTVAAAVAVFSLGTGVASAAVNDIGTDTSIHNGYAVPKPYGKERFNIAQVGGVWDGQIYGQSTYASQMAIAKAQGQRAHTYLWLEGGNVDTSNALADTFLPKVAANQPQGAIVAVDYERGASGNKQANTDAIITLMQRIKDAGMTPLLYGYKSYLLSNVYLDQVVNRFGTSLWVAQYPDYSVTPAPNYNYFPSLNGIALFQFTSTYLAGGLDASVDLTGVTDNGYTSQPVAPTAPVAPAPAKPKANTVSFKGTFVIDKWVRYNGRLYFVNYDMGAPKPIDYNQLIPVGAVTLTDRYGNTLANQYAQGNNGRMEFGRLDGHYTVLQHSGGYVKVSINGEPVWLDASYVTFD